MGLFNKMKKSVSVIIPVYNDVKRLTLCLDSLSKQTYFSDKFEVIIVDNGKNSGLDKLIKKYNKINIKKIKESKPGLHISRNTGIKNSNGNILAFTDADCIPNKDWIKNGVKAINSQKNIGLVAGNIKIFFKNQKKPTSAELFDKLTGFNQKKYIKIYHFGATANIFTTREVIKNVGFLDGTLKSANLEETH